MPSTGVGILIGQSFAGFNQYINNVIMDSASGSQPLAGILLQQTSDLRISNSEIQHQGNGLQISPSSGQLAFGIYISQTFFDSSSGRGLIIVPSGTGSVDTVRFTSSWFGNNTLDGALVSNPGSGTVSNIHFVDPHFVSNSGQGLSITGGTDVTSVGGEASGNSNGVVVAANITDFTVIGMAAGAYGGNAGNTNWGILISAGTSDHYQVFGNRLQGNGAGTISDGGSGTNKHVENDTGTILSPIALANVTSITYSGGGSQTAIFQNTNNNSPMIFYNTGGTANQRKWAWVPNGTSLYLQAFNDALSFQGSIAKFDFAGTTEFPGGIGATLTFGATAQSAAAWTTSGIRLVGTAQSYTDTSSSGTVATAYTDVFSASTILASSATTYTNYYQTYFVEPVASTNVTMTSKWAIGADSMKVVGSVAMTGLPTSTPGGTPSTVCWSSTAGILWTDAVATGPCGIASAKEFKDELGVAATPDIALIRLTQLPDKLPLWSYKNGRGKPYHVGLYADDVEKMDPQCVEYKEGKVYNYEDRCVIAYLVGSVKALKAELEIMKGIR